MISPENDIKIKKLWDDLSYAEKLSLLSENNFWEGFSIYRYEYIPEDLKNILMRRIEEKGANLPKL